VSGVFVATRHWLLHPIPSSRPRAMRPPLIRPYGILYAASARQGHHWSFTLLATISRLTFSRTHMAVARLRSLTMPSAAPMSIASLVGLN